MRGGHLWIYGEEVERPPAPPAPGEVVRVVDSRGAFVATAAFHPHAPIAGRILSRRDGEVVDGAFVHRRLARALAVRGVAVPGREAFRQVHGEADGLPGLVVDRYGPLAVVQPNSAWSEGVLGDVLEALRGTPGIGAALVRADSSAREAEGLSRRVEIGFGDVPEEAVVEEGGLRFAFSPRTGQKTGLFLDMRDNRERCLPWFPGRRVLDLFGYVGQWAVRAAGEGARLAVTVDSSADASARAAENASRNGLGDVVRAVRADVFEWLKECEGAFDVVICDPPAFVKSRRHLDEGTARYHHLNQLALRAVVDGGVLVTASCSHNLDEATLEEIVAIAAHRHGREVLRIYRGGQSADHPILPRHPNSAYLKCLAFVVRGSPS